MTQHNASKGSLQETSSFNIETLGHNLEAQAFISVRCI